jgi:hypothetical protein
MDYDEETLRLLRKADWELISLKLLKFAIAIGGRSIVAKGMDYQDVVKDVITKTFSGERKWNPEIILFFHLKEAVRSSLSIKGLYGNKDRSKRVSTPVQELEICDNEQENGLTDELIEIKKLIKGNKDLEDVFEAILTGALKPRDIAKATGIEPQQVSEHKRTLKRYWIKINGENK